MTENLCDSQSDFLSVIGSKRQKGKNEQFHVMGGRKESIA